MDKLSPGKTKYNRRQQVLLNNERKKKHKNANGYIMARVQGKDVGINPSILEIFR